MQGHTRRLCSSKSIPLSNALFVEKKAPPKREPLFSDGTHAIIELDTLVRAFDWNQFLNIFPVFVDR